MKNVFHLFENFSAPDKSIYFSHPLRRIASSTDQEARNVIADLDLIFKEKLFVAGTIAFSEKKISAYDFFVYNEPRLFVDKMVTSNHAKFQIIKTQLPFRFKSTEDSWLTYKTFKYSQKLSRGTFFHLEEKEIISFSSQVTTLMHSKLTQPLSLGQIFPNLNEQSDIQILCYIGPDRPSFFIRQLSSLEKPIGGFDYNCSPASVNDQEKADEAVFFNLIDTFSL